MNEWPDRTEYWLQCIAALRDYAATGKSSRLKPAMATYIADRIQSALWGYPPREWKLGENCSYNDSYDVPDEVSALRYIDYARAGIVKDDTAPKTVRKEFGVNVKTVRRWRNEDFADHAWWWRAPSDSARAAAMTEAERANNVTREMMMMAAGHYKRRNGKAGTE